MITSFFQAKSSKKVKPVEADRPKRASESGNFDEDTGRSPSNKRLKATSAPIPAASTIATTSTHSFFQAKQQKKTTSCLSPDAAAVVEELLSALNYPETNTTTERADAREVGEEHQITRNSSVSWRTALAKHTSSPSFANLARFVQSQRKSHKVFPPANDTFSALNLTPLDKVKVVIVGQDPYHGPRQAHGLSFSVHRGERIPPSLRNIYKELVNDKDISNVTHPPTHGYLERWAQQGVLMLNAVLTVRQGEANSHKNKGWEGFTDAVLKAVDRESRGGVVFLLWGKPATLKVETALGGLANAQRRGHTIIATSHPSPLGATKTNSPFTGSKCFSRANQALAEKGLEPIDWQVDGPI